MMIFPKLQTANRREQRERAHKRIRDTIFDDHDTRDNNE